MDERNRLIGWLNDAYSLEQSLIQSLDMQIPLMEDHPETQARLEEHQDETERHKEMVAAAIKSLGSSPSTAKAALGSVSGFFSGLMNVGSDQAVRNLVTDYAMEHMEIATYRSLAAAAEVLDETEIVAMCEEILEDELRMAQWIEDHLPHVVKTRLLT
jgi:ferritin-like metal-binding protein YciE